jgi:hypothetical protein
VQEQRSETLLHCSMHPPLQPSSRHNRSTRSLAPVLCRPLRWPLFPPPPASALG